jgi:hypothetical protein
MKLEDEHEWWEKERNYSSLVIRHTPNTVPEIEAFSVRQLILTFSLHCGTTLLKDPKIAVVMCSL